MLLEVLSSIILLCICLSLYIYYVRPEIIIQFKARQQLYQSGLQSKSVKAGNFRWSYAERGTPNRNYPSLVFIHGFSMAAFRWAQVSKFFPKNQHIVIPNLPGHGGTDQIDIPDDMYTTFADKIHEFIRLVGLENNSVHIIGVSMGGVIAACYSATYPENVVATTIMAPAMETPITSEMLQEIKRGKVSCLIDFTEDGIRRKISMASYKGAELSNQIVTGILRAGGSYEDFFIKLHEKLISPNNLARTVKEAKKVTSPSQVIWGENDQLLHVSGADTLKKSLPNVKEVHIIPQCGHVDLLTDGLKLATLLIEFRQKHVYKHGN